MAGPAGKGQGMAVAGCNYVGQDEIWKDHVHHEETAAKSWPNNWNFLTTKYEDLVKDDFPQKDKKPVEPLAHLRPPPVTPLEERVKVYPSPQPVPDTTAGMIGWRSTVPLLKLEKYGKYAKGKGGLVKQLNWPPEAIG